MNKFFRERVNRINLSIRGLWNFFRSGVHARLHLVSILLVIIFGVFFDLSAGEWVAILFAIGLVVQSEIFNTILEDLMDFVHVEYHSRIKYMKDMSSAAVMFCSIIALLIALIIFIPKMF